jgi:phage portal protein BeeE
MAWYNKLKFWGNNKEEKDSKTFSILGSKSPSGTVWSTRDYENFAKETYLKNAIAFRCIDMIAKDFSSVPWEHFRKLPDNKREQISGSWVTDLIKRPNPSEGWAFLMLKYAAYLSMSGNSFFERVKPDTGPNKDDIKELYTLRPDRFEFGLDKERGTVNKYIYKVNGQKVE